ncbi:hypothetical protein AB0M46_14805 [Dactylosporangium sp. NPDC051485]|uniref:hypothetical protein n=1 Tax=Dactylosporangium sp. NPDC051485 TaxID=3154846 RepID=UPI00342A9AD5
MSPEEVLQSYAEQDVEPGRMSADEVLRTARATVRRGRARVVVVAGAAALLVLAGVAFALPSRRPDRGLPAVPPSAGASASPAARVWPPAVTGSAAPLTCTPSALPEMPGDTPLKRTVDAIDPTGRWIVGHSSLGLLVWHDDKVTNPVPRFVPAAVNASGAIGGFEVQADGKKRAAIVRGGGITRLPLPDGGVSSQVFAIDANGDALGSATIEGKATWEYYLPVVWPAAGGVVPVVAPPDLQPKDSTPVGASALSDDGVMLGWVERDHRLVTYRWNLDGTGTVLEDSPVFQAYRVAGDWVVGEGKVGPADVTTVATAHARWNRRTGTADAMGAFQTIGLSATGRAFGVRDTADFRPAVWHDGTVTALPLRNPARGEVLGGGISADGRTIVAGTGTREGKDGPIDITRWTC